MIIESAFLKLPELLTGIEDHRGTYEATVSHCLSIAAFAELSARGIPLLYQQIYQEQAYDTRARNGQTIHADMLVNLTRVLETDGRIATYGVRKKNWIEIKAFLASARSTGSAPTTKDVGDILHDLLRLCVLPKESEDGKCENGRYFLLVCSDSPKSYPALAQKEWLVDLLLEGSREVSVNLANEPKPLREAVGIGFVQTPDLTANFKVRTMSFQPELTDRAPVFWGYLLRILGFDVTVSGYNVKFDDQPEAMRDKTRIEKLDNVRQSILMKFSAA